MRPALALASLALAACAPQGATLPDPPDLDPSPAAYVASTERLAPATPSYTVQMLDRAHLIVTSHLADRSRVVVVWISERGGTYREAFALNPELPRRVWPDCFYGGHYTIKLAGTPWTRERNFPATVAYCY